MNNSLESNEGEGSSRLNQRFFLDTTYDMSDHPICVTKRNIPYSRTCTGYSNYKDSPMEEQSYKSVIRVS